MPGPWKEWKTKPRFPTLPIVPWKSRKHREISTFPPPRLAPHGKVENQKTVSHFPTRYTRRRLRFPSVQNPNPKKGSRPLRGLLILPTFRIILYWNQDPVSGSFLDWKMLHGGFPKCCCRKRRMTVLASANLSFGMLLFDEWAAHGTRQKR